MLDFIVIAVFGLVTFSSIVLFYHHYLSLWFTRESQRQCSLGGLFGIGTVLLMLHPVEIAPGLLLDARFLLIGFAGLLTGWRGIVIALTLSITTRLFIGGQGALIGCLTLLLSAGIGLAWRSLQGKLTFGPFWRFLAFGAALSLSLITVTLFPEPSRASAITKALPFLVVLNMVGGLIAGYLNISVREVAKSRAYMRQLALFDDLNP